MITTCIDTATKAARRYVSPRTRPLTSEEAQIRALAYAIKDPDCDRDLIEAAAREMAKLIEGERGYLVPVPSHTRSTVATRHLANAVAFCTGGKFEVTDVLDRKSPTASSCELHRLKLPPLSEPKNSQFFFPIALGRIAFSTRLLSISISPSPAYIVNHRSLQSVNKTHFSTP